MKEDEFKREFRDRSIVLGELRRVGESIISRALVETGSPTLPLQSRVKDQDSAYNKISRKGYKDPFTEMTDLVAFRIITYLDSDIEPIVKKLRTCFEVDERGSVDKRNPENVNIVGYRSNHLICKLGEGRARLPEYDKITDILFEIQIRTALEHTWAEIEHKLNYKSETSLPRDLQRRFMVISGTLELIDRELSKITQESQDYAKDVALGTKDTLTDALSTTSIVASVESFAKKRSIEVRLNFANKDELNDLVQELKDFEVDTVGKFQDFLSRIKHTHTEPGTNSNTIFGLVRIAMIAEDYKKYFRNSFKNNYLLLSDNLPQLTEASGDPNFRIEIEKMGIMIDDDF
ncbi:GTP pyrophosphokinase [Salipiger bermudensis]|uniref:GTP pyrophosphokinase n=1 Tax=Salipiger bermudensis TaxID=344736 RepID=UPI001CD7F827|nr:hypothetical protein [Salipiger bermudensis]MCA1284836.1 hypothetical protein [Salipiger bermudensis]